MREDEAVRGRKGEVRDMLNKNDVGLRKKRLRFLVKVNEISRLTATCSMKRSASVEYVSGSMLVLLLRGGLGTVAKNRHAFASKLRPICLVT